ncbi:GAF domain-containing protein [Mesorhizobium sangaii]|uniref:histidine kinase n=1 Tax=Mesorhizobium sangaii TaxID=505389 RepID=A0A841P5V0_9HYPH|nr:GAF domain-containing protein [Mesorhizobium sangaii]MBB6410704.1 GAF domain-containing protein [Mesorhizobium sangaii]
MTISSLRSELTAAREENQVRTAEVANLLEQQNATSAILRVIAASPTDIQPVLQVVAESAARFCDTYDAGIFLARDGTLFPKAHYGPIAFDFEPMPVARDWVCGRAFADCKTVHVNDIAVAGAEFPVSQTLAERLGHRTMLATPLMRDTEAIGALVIRRIEVKSFSEKQIKLLKIFADQAVIAIENVRLFDEVQARTRDLGEALEQQTATAEVLKAISRSAFDLQPVLQTLVDSAIRLAGADMGAITLRVGDTLRFMAGGGQAAELHAYERANPHVVGRGTFQGRAALEGLTIHVADALEDPEYERPEAAIMGSFRGVLSVPMKRGQETIGVFGLARRTIGLFSPRQVELVESFADQAVIAIENARLIEKVEGHNRELAESLDQQTATAEVLKTISSSVFDLDSVLHTLVKSASDLCHSGMGYIYLRQGDVLQPTVQIGWSQEFQDHMNNLPVTPGRGSIAARVAQSGSVEQITDVLDDPEYTNIEGQRLGGFRTLLGVPLMRDGAVTGVFVLARSSVSPFSTREIELVQTFSDQAVIAIENVRLFEEVESRNRDLAESLEQQMATGAILQVIAGSPTDIQPVLDAVAESAARLCDAYDATIYLLRSDRLAVGAHHGPIPIDSAGLPVARDIVTGRAVLDRVPVHVHDLTIAGEEFATGRMMAQRLGFRAILATPLLQEGKAIGALMIRRIEARPFSDSQIGLLKTFANQAVIAIGNVRLFEEVQARTAELGEALQQQTATADVLKVISRSAFDLQSVLQTLIDSAVRLCGAKTSGIFMRDGDVFRLAAGYDQTPKYRAYEEANPSPMSRQSWVGRTALDKAVVHIPDVTKDTEHGLPEAPRLGGYSAVLCVPLMREGSVIGVFAMTRPEPGPFTESQIELVQTFADQAVIAIENVRLFEEVQARTAELSESLQQQTATADVLKAISRSTFDLRAVLDALAESVTRLCEADNASIVRETDGKFVEAASYGYPAELEEYFSGFVHVPGRGTGVGRVLLEGNAVQIPDVLADADYTLWEGQRLGGYRTVLAVPLLREGVPIGVFSLTRSTVRPFTERQIELVETFADQAVIAIENVRLFDEVQARTAELSESLQLQTATADVLKAISRSTFDLQPVLDTLAESAAKLCDADTSVIFKRDGDLYRWSAEYGNLPEAATFAKANPFAAGRDSVTGRVALEARAVHVSDVLADPDYGATQLQKLGGYRTILCVPILREGAPVGVFALTRSQVRDFTPRQIELVETFADQSGIAIENVRLFDEVQARTRELSRSLEDLRTAQDRLVQTEKLASLGQLTAGIAHEIKNPLNFVNNFSTLSGELIDDLNSVLAGAPLEASVREEVGELTAILKSNLDKVVQHGKRADSIVRNMLLHSRAGSGEHRAIDINAIVEESLNLAYHGARAEKPGFNVTLTRNFDPQAGDVDLYPQEITRVLLNLISNGFYATAKRSAAANGAGYEPTLSATTMSLGDRVEIRIRDNGTGIPPEVKEKMFNPFFTTKPAGEGTGLGLSLSHDIIVKQHAGTIDVISQPGEFTEFRIVLPRAAASLAKSGGEE